MYVAKFILLTRHMVRNGATLRPSTPRHCPQKLQSSNSTIHNCLCVCLKTIHPFARFHESKGCSEKSFQKSKKHFSSTILNNRELSYFTLPSTPLILRSEPQCQHTVIPWLQDQDQHFVSWRGPRIHSFLHAKHQHDLFRRTVSLQMIPFSSSNVFLQGTKISLICCESDWLLVFLEVFTHLHGLWITIKTQTQTTQVFNVRP